MRKDYFPLNETFIKIPVAHRGLHNDHVSENSMESFKLAIEKGYNIEIDVHLMKDKNIAVIHDSSLKRVCGVDVNIEDLTKEDLKNYPLTLSNEIIPTLDELLDLIDGRVGLLIEVKGEKFSLELVERLIEVLSNYKYKDKIALQAFNPKFIREFKRRCSDFSFGFLSADKIDIKNKIAAYLLQKLIVFKHYHGDFISYHVDKLPLKHVTKLQKEGYQLLVWTINTKERLIHAREVADNIIFEKIELE